MRVSADDYSKKTARFGAKKAGSGDPESEPENAIFRPVIPSGNGGPRPEDIFFNRLRGALPGDPKYCGFSLKFFFTSAPFSGYNFSGKY